MSPAPARMIGPGSGRPRHALAALAVRAVFAALLAALAFAPHAAAAKSAPASGPDGDALIKRPISGERSKDLAAWIRTANLDALLRLLRHDAAKLGPDEKPIVDAAWKLTPASDKDLRRRLDARRQLTLAEAGDRKAERELADLQALRPRQSVWRIGVLLPNRGDYAGYAVSVRTALEAGLIWGGASEPFLLEVHGTGDAEPARAAAALDSAAMACGVIVGELLSEPTFALAAGTRIAGIPLLSPTATDEDIGRSGSEVFQVGPASAERGRALAHAVLGGKPRRVAILTSSGAARGPLATSFAAAAESLGATIVRRDVYAAANADFKTLSRGVRTFGAEVLFWDGDSREAAALLRQLGADGISVRVCGGTALSPEQFHAGEKVLLEGVTYVDDDWSLAPAQQAVVDSIAQSRGERAGSLWTRGFLTGRRLQAAVHAGARTPPELAAKLRHRDPLLRAGGYLDCALDGATLPVWLIERGKPVNASRP